MNKEDIIIPEDFRYEPPVISEFPYNSMALVHGTTTPEGPGFETTEKDPGEDWAYETDPASVDW